MVAYGFVATTSSPQMNAWDHVVHPVSRPPKLESQSSQLLELFTMRVKLIYGNIVKN